MKTKTKSRRKPDVHAGKQAAHRNRRENTRLRSLLLENGELSLPPLPAADENGHYPAIETARAIIARQLIRDRKAVGWTQAELAARAGVRQETISRIETGKHSPGLKTMAKIDRALRKAGRN